MKNRYELNVSVDGFDCIYSWGKSDPPTEESGYFHNRIELTVFGTTRHSNRDLPATIEIITLTDAEPSSRDAKLFQEIDAVGLVSLTKNSLRISTAIPASKLQILLSLLCSEKLSRFHLIRGRYDESLDDEKRADLYYFFAST